MEYLYNYYISRRYRSSCFYLKHNVSETGPCRPIDRARARAGCIDWAQLSRFYLKMETESVSEVLYFLNKNKAMDNIQKHNKYINIASSQTFRSYLNKIFIHSHEIVLNYLHLEIQLREFCKL
jgi:hypothetical protein